MVNISADMIVATGSAIAAVLVASGTLIVSLRNGRMAVAAAKSAMETAKESASKIEEVHVLVNGGLTEHKKEIARLSGIIAKLTGAAGDESHAATTADQAKDSVKLSKDMMDKLPNG